MNGTISRAVAVAAAATLALAGCGSGDDPTDAAGDEQISAADVRAALQAGGELTVWAWEPTLAEVVTGFQAAYPNVTVELVNAGTGDDQYTALQNAIAAGDGLPDVAQIEYYALPQFALAGSVTDLTGYGAGDLADTFTPGPWSSVNTGGGVHGLPMDSGPMALFYNQEVFDEHGIDVPATWAEYVDAARDLHRADPQVYITNDVGDAGFTTSLIWQSGGQPFQVDGTEVSIDFTDDGSARFADTWQQLISEDLLAPVSSWSDQWYQGLADGTIASLATGAWMPANLISGVADGAGKWRVAPLPQWDAGGTASAENGGSSLAVPSAAANRALAYGFIEYANAGDGVQIRVDGGAFPATTAQLQSPEFLGAEFAYFGGQRANEIFAESAGDVVDGWSYLPFQVYANSVFNDTVGQAYVSDTPLTDALTAWRDTCVSYGTDQGFTVS
ncbi:carbohydrate ABC transporter substrate-binding protein (CUT1 family) [Micromonospora sp. Llam0]|uniref:ABC transporter substrate-binding protein n=1 Tax=Micromonospora sp. Llam0 TaxID=2485143 RepID=UPI000F49366B|nr:extracellular solute-binding protein [Micromonospora sp. Llam0]ROO61494.1 carbohydrate ABC transporter substrate-binding protein (CUT1 family) [Micromonospora sp. Llam0]